MSEVNIPMAALSVFLIVITIAWIKATLQVRELNNICLSLKQANDNILKTFPDIKILLAATEKGQTELKVQQKVRLYKMTRTKGAPDITLGEISEILISAENEEKAKQLVDNVKLFKDDGWWILEESEEEAVIKVNYMGGYLDA